MPSSRILFCPQEFEILELDIFHVMPYPWIKEYFSLSISQAHIGECRRITINSIALITFPVLVNLPLKIEWKALTFKVFSVICR